MKNLVSFDDLAQRKAHEKVTDGKEIITKKNNYDILSNLSEDAKKQVLLLLKGLENEIHLLTINNKIEEIKYKIKERMIEEGVLQEILPWTEISADKIIQFLAPQEIWPKGTTKVEIIEAIIDHAQKVEKNKSYSMHEAEQERAIKMLNYVIKMFEPIVDDKVINIKNIDINTLYEKSILLEKIKKSIIEDSQEKKAILIENTQRDLNKKIGVSHSKNIENTSIRNELQKIQKSAQDISLIEESKLDTKVQEMHDKQIKEIKKQSDEFINNLKLINIPKENARELLNDLHNLTVKHIHNLDFAYLCFCLNQAERNKFLESKNLPQSSFAELANYDINLFDKFPNNDRTTFKEILRNEFLSYVEIFTYFLHKLNTSGDRTQNDLVIEMARNFVKVARKFAYEIEKIIVNLNNLVVVSIDFYDYFSVTSVKSILSMFTALSFYLRLPLASSKENQDFSSLELLEAGIKKLEDSFENEREVSLGNFENLQNIFYYLNSMGEFLLKYPNKFKNSYEDTSDDETEEIFQKIGFKTKEHIPEIYENLSKVIEEEFRVFNLFLKASIEDPSMKENMKELGGNLMKFCAKVITEYQLNNYLRINEKEVENFRNWNIIYENVNKTLGGDNSIKVILSGNLEYKEKIKNVYINHKHIIEKLYEKNKEKINSFVLDVISLDDLIWEEKIVFLEFIAKLIENVEEGTYRHSDEVGYYMGKFACEMAREYKYIISNYKQSNLSPEQIFIMLEIGDVPKCNESKFLDEIIKVLTLAGKLHDIGKIKVSNFVTLKPGRFNKEEYLMMLNHVIYGGEILRNLADHTKNEKLKRTCLFLAEICEQHHEKFNGTGQKKLKGEEIFWGARMCSVVDTFVAIKNNRPYNETNHLSSAEIFAKSISEIVNDASSEKIKINKKLDVSTHYNDNGITLDPFYVKRFLRLFDIDFNEIKENMKVICSELSNKIEDVKLIEKKFYGRLLNTFDLENQEINEAIKIKEITNSQKFIYESQIAGTMQNIEKLYKDREILNLVMKIGFNEDYLNLIEMSGFSAEEIVKIVLSHEKSNNFENSAAKLAN